MRSDGSVADELNEYLRVIQIADVAALVMSLCFLLFLGLGTFSIRRRLRALGWPRVAAALVTVALLVASVVVYYVAFFWIARATSTLAYSRIESAKYVREMAHSRAISLVFASQTFLCPYPGWLVSAATLFVVALAAFVESFVARRRRIADLS